MASASVKSAVARIGAIDYANLDELKMVKIPKIEQENVEKLLKFKPAKKKTPPPGPLQTEKANALLRLFEAGIPLKCVRMPKREQRVTQMYIDDHPDAR